MNSIVKHNYNYLLMQFHKAVCDLIQHDSSYYHQVSKGYNYSLFWYCNQEQLFMVTSIYVIILGPSCMFSCWLARTLHYSIVLLSIKFIIDGSMIAASMCFFS